MHLRSSKPRGISPRKWGSCAWTFLHYVALGYPAEGPSTTAIREYYVFLDSLGDVLPCQACRTNYREHFLATPPNEALSRGRDALFDWTVSMHNKVNVATGRREMSTKVMKARYESGNVRATPTSRRVAESIASACAGAILAFIIVKSRRHALISRGASL